MTRDSGGHFVVGDGQWWGDLDDVAADGVGDDAEVPAGEDGLGGQDRVRCLGAGFDELDTDGQAPSSDVADVGGAWSVGGCVVTQRLGQLGASVLSGLGQGSVAEDVEDGESCCAGDGVADGGHEG